jgi:lysyl-tRNA synthetase class 2
MQMRLEAIEAVERSRGRAFFTPTPRDSNLAPPISVASALSAAHGSDVSVLARVTAKRALSKQLVFVTVRDVTAVSGDEIQVKLQDAALAGVAQLLRRGDVVRVRGVRGARDSIVAATCELEAPMLRPWQLAYDDRHQLHSQRYIDLLSTPGALARFVRRSQALRAIRAHFDDVLGAVEVETPTLAALAGGAAAVPFETHANALDQRLFLRIAPELYLKQLIVGGFPRVYEIGKQFRNEGVDRRHNPEFTTLEYYVRSTARSSDLMQLTRDLITRCSRAYSGATPTVCASATIDFGAPYRRISFVDELSRALAVPDVLASERRRAAAARRAPRRRRRRRRIAARQAVRHALLGARRAALEQPTFVLEHPVELSPLARTLPGRPRVAERFEFFAGGMELANAYGELADPREQARRFAAQHPDDAEAMPADQQFLEALRYALPPTAGYGLGIDRLVHAARRGAVDSRRDSISNVEEWRVE